MSLSKSTLNLILSCKHVIRVYFSLSSVDHLLIIYRREIYGIDEQEKAFEVADKEIKVQDVISLWKEVFTILARYAQR
jgi:hypothetical protein